RNRNRLFTFLEHDGIPWNNNNAENAIKAFAKTRRVFDAGVTVDGLDRTLLLLSADSKIKLHYKAQL
ncbi:MAG: transposase, partial [Pseudomonadota bacterium]